MRQTYEVWDAFKGRPVELTVESVIDDWEGFRILLRDHKSGGMIRISFACHVAYRSRDESDFVMEANRSDGLGNGYTYKVRNSEFMRSFMADALGPYEGLEHFAIVTESDCIDVLAIGGGQVDSL